MRIYSDLWKSFDSKIPTWQISENRLPITKTAERARLYADLLDPGDNLKTFEEIFTALDYLENIYGYEPIMKAERLAFRSIELLIRISNINIKGLIIRYKAERLWALIYDLVVYIGQLPKQIRPLFSFEPVAKIDLADTIYAAKMEEQLNLSGEECMELAQIHALMRAERLGNLLDQTLTMQTIEQCIGFIAQLTRNTGVCSFHLLSFIRRRLSVDAMLSHVNGMVAETAVNPEPSPPPQPTTDISTYHNTNNNEQGEDILTRFLVEKRI